jgi:hypothetical protein
MPVTKNKPWPPGHPFLGGAIVFRQRQPDSSEKPSTDEGQPQEANSHKLPPLTQEELNAMAGRMQNFQGCIPGSNPPEEEE